MSDEKGLYLLVNPTGSKLWRWKYCVDGAEKLMALGNFPDVSPTGGQDMHDEARKLLATGVDPMARRKSDDVAKKLASEHSFAAVAGEWWAHWKPARSERHAISVMRRLEADVFPVISARPVSEIKAPELVAMVKTIAARSAIKQGSGLLLSHLMFMLFLIVLRNMIIKNLTPYAERKCL